MRGVIAEDSVLLRAGLVELLRGAGYDVSAVPDADQLLREVERNPPDAVVADVRMPPTHTDEGLRAAVLIRRSNPGVAVLVLSQYVEERYAGDLIAGDTGGVGYLLKDRVADVAEFLDALRRVIDGGTALAALLALAALGYLVPRWRDRLRWPMVILALVATASIVVKQTENVITVNSRALKTSGDTGVPSMARNPREAKKSTSNVRQNTRASP